MKSFPITSEQYDAIKSHLVLQTEPALPEDVVKYGANCYPCYRFEPRELAEKDEDIEAIVFLGRRNPWNCAQMLVAIFPDILNLL